MNIKFPSIYFSLSSYIYFLSTLSSLINILHEKYITRYSQKFLHRNKTFPFRHIYRSRFGNEPRQHSGCELEEKNTERK